MDREDNNVAHMKKEVENLRKEENLSIRRLEVDVLRQQLADQRTRVTRLRGNTDSFKTESRNVNTKKAAACANLGNELRVDNNDTDKCEIEMQLKTKKIGRCNSWH